MTDTTPAPTPSPMAATATSIFQRLMNFDNLIGSALVKIVYFVGLAAIILGVLFAVLGAFSTLQFAPMQGLVAIVAALIAGVIAVVMWRFICELWLLAFMIYARMGDIRDRLSPR